MKAGYPIVYRLTQAEIDAGVATPLTGGFVEVIDANGSPTGTVYQTGPAGQAAQTLATATTVSTAVSTVTVKNWQGSTAVLLDEVRRATLTAGTIEAGDLIRSNSARTTGVTFDATEAGNWTEFSPDIVTSVAGRAGAVVLTSSDVGLANVTNTSDANKPVSTAQQTALNLKQDASTAATDAELTAHTGNVTNPHGVTKTQVGLANVDNTSDANKPVSTATQTALDAKQATLVSGTNIKTINGQALPGAGNLAVGASAASVTTNTGGTGGTVTQVGNDRVHTFLADGSFVVPAGVSSVQVLAVAGGGGGGTGRYAGDTLGRPGGGGGAGGRILNTTFAVTPGATIPVTVGLGGAGATDLADTDNSGTGGVNGSNSVFSTLTAVGGGGGGGHYQVQQGVVWDAPANVGGSGGGGSNGSAGAAGTAGQGNAGGGAVSGGSGGGGAGGTGGNGGNTPAEGDAGGAGGIGAASTITGSSVTSAVGGASSGTPTVGVVGTSGAANTGNGGGGSTRGGSNGRTANTSPGGAGGSGIVIVRYIYQSLDTPIFANNAAALAGSLTLGMLYRTGADPDLLAVVH